jgi:ketosteroid isomerase-like protein
MTLAHGWRWGFSLEANGECGRRNARLQRQQSEVRHDWRINMTSRPRIVRLLLLFLFASAGVTLAQSNQKEADAVRAADAAWLNAWATKDVDKSVAFFDEQGSMLSPGDPIATGKRALTKLIASGFALTDYKLAWVPDKVGVAHSGDLGYTSGTYDWSFRDSSGRMVFDKGKYLTLWKKQPDGSWKVLFDMFNSDLPPS